MSFQKMDECPNCARIGQNITIMSRDWDMWGERVWCLVCGYEEHPMLDSSVLPLHIEAVITLPSSGKDTYTWKEKQTRPKARGGRPPSHGRNSYRKVEK